MKNSVFIAAISNSLNYSLEQSKDEAKTVLNVVVFY